MMHETVFRGRNAETRFSNTQRKIVVFEHADPEAFVKWADPVPDGTRQQSAKQRSRG